MGGFLLFAVSILSLGAIYAMLCLALNLECGIGGLWDLGIVSFFGAGAYTYTLLTVPPAAAHQGYALGLGLPMGIGLIAAGLAGAAVAYLIGLPTLRLKREYFLIVTLAFAEVIRQIYANEGWLTNGVAGIYGQAQPFRAAVPASLYGYLLLAILLAGLGAVYLLVRRMASSTFGRTLKAIRENENLAMTAGIKPRRFNMMAFVAAGVISGIAGVFYVWYNTLITPAQFDSDVTFFAWTALIIGGIGNVRGALVGGFIFIVLHDMLRFVQVSGENAVAVTSLRTAIVGLVLIIILRVRPNGLLPERPASFDDVGAAEPRHA